MSGPLLFGDPGRTLFGLLHSRTASHELQPGALLLCAPLLQEGIRSHRALWALAESMAAGGSAALCFDWYGTGDSAGEDFELSLPGMLADLDTAALALAARSGDERIEYLALRSAALPLLAWLGARAQPVELILWDPQLVGSGVVESWHQQHQAQLHGTGRYPHARHEPDPDDLLGFRVDSGLLSALSTLDHTRSPLPRGSRVRLALWQRDDDIERFIQTQRDNGVHVDVVELEDSDRPGWEDPAQFGAQAFPRRSVTRLAQRLAAMEAR